MAAKSSVVSAHFDLPENKDGKSQAKCKHCLITISTSGKTTSNLLNRLKGIKSTMDDDEFGGFEAAEEDEQEAQPIVDGVQASPSPWAFFPGQNQPDLIRPPGNASASSSAEIRPNVQDPLEPNFPQGQASFSHEAGGAIGGAPAASSHNAPAGASNSPGLDWDADFKEFALGPGSRSLSEQVLEPHFGSIKSEKPVPDGVLDLDLTQRQQGNRPHEDLDLELEPDIQNVQAANQVDKGAETSQSENQRQRRSINERAEQENGNELGQLAEAAPVVQNEALVGQLRVAEEAKTNLQKELEELITSNQLLEDEITSLKVQLDEQKAKYSTVQEKHLTDLDEMRKAGQDAMAIIVEDYKELCKVAVLEQQNNSQVQLQDAITKEQDKWKELLNIQQEEFQSQLEEERKKMAEEIKQSLETEKTQHSERITKLVSEEKQQLQEEFQKSMEQIKQETETSIAETFTAEKQKWKEELEEEKDRMKSLLEEERELSKETLSKAVKDESQRCQECMREAIKEERENSQKLLKEAVNSAQEDMKASLEEQKQRDLVIKKKSLHSVDLLLDSARHQLKLLLDKDSCLQLDTSPVHKDRQLGNGDQDQAGS